MSEGELPWERVSVMRNNDHEWFTAGHGKENDYNWHENGRFIPESKALELYEGVKLLLALDSRIMFQGLNEADHTEIDKAIALLKGVDK